MEKVIYKFELEANGQVFKFEVDNHKKVWLIERDGSGSNYGQIKLAENLEHAKEIALLMLYASNRIKK